MIALTPGNQIRPLEKPGRGGETAWITLLLHLLQMDGWLLIAAADGGTQATATRVHARNVHALLRWVCCWGGAVGSHGGVHRVGSFHHGVRVRLKQKNGKNEQCCQTIVISFGQI